MKLYSSLENTDAFKHPYCWLNQLQEVILKLLMTLISLVFLSACVPQVDNIQIARGEIALSFDDAPRGKGAYLSGEERTDMLIEALKSVEAPPAVFFVTTRGLKTRAGQDRVSKYAEAGNLIANHSDTHPWASKVGLESVISEIDIAEEKLAQFTNRRPWFRFPFLDEGNTLSLRDGIRQVLKERELSNGYVTVDNFDWYVAGQVKKAVRDGRFVDQTALGEAYVEMLVEAVDFYDELILDGIGKQPPHVLLLHENDLAALFIDDLIIALRKEGWTVVSPDKAYSHPIAKVQPSTLNAGSGLFAALSVDAGLTEKRLQTWVNNEEAIDSFLKDKKVFGDIP